MEITTKLDLLLGVAQQINPLISRFNDLVEELPDISTQRKLGKSVEKSIADCHRVLASVAVSLPAEVETEVQEILANLESVFSILSVRAGEIEIRAGDPDGWLVQWKGEIPNRTELCGTGCGIPPDEAEGIIAFGVRGSNVKEHPTRGGGFGLTKAYYKTKRQNGRMWIDDNNGKGTRIEIRIPDPGF